MRLITLSDGSTTKVDDEDYEGLLQYRWFPTGARSRYVGRMTREGGRKKVILLHRQVMATPLGVETDHINRDPRDNQKANLRWATHLDNMQNQGARRGRNPLLYDVSMVNDGRPRPYRAEAKMRGRRLYFGSFATLEEAAEAVAKGRSRVENREI